MRKREIRIPVGWHNKQAKYLIWNRNLEIGEETSNEDLWKQGYEFGCTKILGIELITARKR